MGHKLITTHGQENLLIKYCDLLSIRFKKLRLDYIWNRNEVRDVNYAEKE